MTDAATRTIPVQGRPDGDAVLEILRNAPAERPGDLRGMRWVGADLRGVDLSECDLSAADLTHADLRGASLVGATLDGAKLAGAKLDDAELLGASLRGVEADHCTADRAGFGNARLDGAQFFEASFEGASFANACLDDADLRCVSARGARFTSASLRRVNAARADFRDASLVSTDVERAHLSEVDLRGAKIQGLRRYESAAFLHADVRDVDWSGAWMVRRHVADQNYLNEFRERGAFHEVLYRLWWLTSDCGRSLWRWSGVFAIVTVIFGFLNGLASVDYGRFETPLSPWYYSLVTLTTLGYGDALPASLGGQILSMITVLVGYVLLGGLISIFSNKMARRAD